MATAQDCDFGYVDVISRSTYVDSLKNDDLGHETKYLSGRIESKLNNFTFVISLSVENRGSQIRDVVSG